MPRIRSSSSSQALSQISSLHTATVVHSESSQSTSPSESTSAVVTSAAASATDEIGTALFLLWRAKQMVENAVKPNLPALDTSMLLLGQPMLAILWAGMIFDESLGTGQWLGVLLVLAGLTIFSVTKAPSAETRQPAVEKVDDPI